jgi:type I restriction enzyme S subunit
MELRPGYKHTEVGVIPEEWETQTILELSSQIIDYRGRTPKKLGMSWGGGDIPALSAGNVRMGFIDFSEDCYFGSDALYKRWMTRGKVAKDDIVFTTEAPLGNIALIPDDRKYILSQRTVLLQIDPDKASSRFLFQLMRSEQFQKVLADHSSGTTAKGIQRKKFEQLRLARPPLPEQCAIATALSDADALLSGLDRLIVKKRDLKQAAAQRLLTGRTRLPGFNGKWEETTLGEIGECVIGLTYRPENVVERGLLVLRSSNIQNRRLDYEDNVYVNLEVAEHLRTRPGDILVCVRNGSRALIGKCALIDDRAAGMTFGAFMSVFRTKHWRFIIHAFQGNDIQRQIRDNIGATINQITNKDMKAFRLKLPPADEQTAIGDVLSEMDVELTALEQRRDKTRDLKQGMMQELLTGRTRLV